jgi:hypothetical protein
MDFNNLIKERKIQIIQINLQNCKRATESLVEHYKNNQIDILLLQEPYTINSRIALFPIKAEVFSHHYKPKSAIIYTRMNDIKGMFLEKFTNELIVWPVFSIDNEDIHLCSAYMPPSKPIEEVLDQINATINEIKPKNLIISYDTNAKSNVWFSKFNNKRGYDMLEFILKNDLTIMNNSSDPTFFTINGQSHIDLTLTNINSNKVNNWKLLDIETNSDHCYISFDILIQLNNQPINNNNNNNNNNIDNNNNNNNIYLCKKNTYIFL